MTYTHVICTNSDGQRYIQPINPDYLGFCEIEDGACLAIIYQDNNPITDAIKEPFVQVMREMVASGMALDCTGTSSDIRIQSGAIALGGAALIGPGWQPQNMIVENLKKQLAAKDDELIAARHSDRMLSHLYKKIASECEKIGFAATSSSQGIDALIDAIWTRQAEINHLNDLIKIQNSGRCREQTAPPATDFLPINDLYEEIAGIGHKDGVTGD